MPTTRTLLYRFGHVFLFTLIIHVALWNLLFSSWSHAQQQHGRKTNQDAASSPQKPQQHYEWQDWDYYKLLGIATDDIAESYCDYEKVNSTTIKRAYRNQAKLWHPDKQQQQQQQQQQQHDAASSTPTTTATATTTEQETKARFLAIVEAYKVLGNAQQKLIYDAHLRQQRQEQKYHYGEPSSASSSSSSSSQYYYPQEQQQQQQQEYDAFGWTTNFMMDPIQRLFEEFFGPDSYHHDPYQQQQQQQEHEQSPTQVTEEQVIYLDPQTGRQYLRVITTQVYPSPPDEDSFHVKYAQDFTEEWDPYLRTFVLQPVQAQAVVLESGYHGYRQQQQQQQQQHQQQKRGVRGGRWQRQQSPPPPPSSSKQQPEASRPINNKSILWPDQVLTGSSSQLYNKNIEILLVDAKDRYRLVLIPSTCDLQIWDSTTKATTSSSWSFFNQNDATTDADAILWTSSDQAFLKLGSHHYDECSLALKGAVLQVIGSTTTTSNFYFYYGTTKPDQRVVWHSDDDVENLETISFDQQQSNQRGSTSSSRSYIGRLDTDGALTVYRVDDKLSRVTSFLLDALDSSTSRRHASSFHDAASTTTTRAARAWQAVATPGTRALESLVRRIANISSRSQLRNNESRAGGDRRKDVKMKSSNTHDSSTNSNADDGPIRLVCVYTTSPVGCFRPARFIWKYTRQVGLVVERLMNVLDRIIDQLFQ